MHKSRLEAFSDGVIAILITIMVLELKVPHGAELKDLAPMGAVFVSYVLSFVQVGVYWNNHHHLMQAVDKVGGSVLWANMHLLFWLSLFPFTTAWMGENDFAPWPVALYGLDAFLCGAAYSLLTRSLVRLHGGNALLARAIGDDRKGFASIALYAVGIPLAFVSVPVALALYVLVMVIWLVPDKRIEKVLGTRAKHG